MANTPRKSFTEQFVIQTDPRERTVADDSASEITLVEPVAVQRQSTDPCRTEEKRDSVKLKTKKWWSRHIYHKCV